MGELGRDEGRVKDKERREHRRRRTRMGRRKWGWNSKCTFPVALVRDFRWHCDTGKDMALSTNGERGGEAGEGKNKRR